jgi:iron complex outermembrane recepter protein
MSGVAKRLDLACLLAASMLLPTARGQTAIDAASPPVATTGGEKLEEIVVTAQKRADNLQNTPAAITEITGNAIVADGITDLRAAQMFVPSVRFQPEQNNVEIFMRGVGTSLDLPSVEPSVGFIFGDVYVPREGTVAAFFDLAEVEALPGPQGTLYGRSSIGGTVNISPVKPSHNSEGFALLEVGNYASVHGTIAQNIPVTDSFALRAAVDYISHTGYETSGADAQKDIATRLSALFDPSDEISALWWAQYADKGGHTPNLVNKGTNPNTGTYCESCFLSSNPWNDTRTGSAASPAPFGYPDAPHESYKTFVTGGRINWTVGPVILTDIPSYFYLNSAPTYWVGVIPAQNSEHYNQISNELRASNAAPSTIDWLGGVYLYQVHNSGFFKVFVDEPQVPDEPPPIYPFNETYSELRNFATFGQATLHANEQIRFTLGGRYSIDSREAYGLSPTALGADPWTFEREFHHIDWKVASEFDVTPDSMLYAAIQTGYKPGSYNEIPATPTEDNLVKPSTLRAYTAGFKTQLLNDSLRINTELFYYNYRDLETEAYDSSLPFNPVFNAQKTRILGAQIDTLYQVISEGRLNLSVGYSHDRFQEFITPQGQNYSGGTLPYSADLTVLAGYAQGFALPSGMLRARVDSRFESAYYGDYEHDPGSRQDPAWKGDVSLTYEAPKDWTVGLWCKNITNKATIGAVAVGQTPISSAVYLDPPRTFGLRATKNW